MGTAFLILLLLALCGFIAYIGDLLGRRFGKKRLSIFGMRPKHTAILLTVRWRPFPGSGTWWCGASGWRAATSAWTSRTTC
jgi:hypothetical protein